MSAGTEIDYEDLAKQAGAISSKPAGADVDYEALAKQAGATSSQPAQATSEASTKNAEPTFTDKVLGAVKGAGIGALKGAGHTLGGLAPLLNKIPYIGETLSPSEGIKAWEQITKPEGTAQKVGFGTEQVGEFLVPGMGEEGMAGKVATKLPFLGKAALPAARIATGALSSGAVNKLQGGSFTGGAALGAGSGAIGEAGRAIAPSLAESALGVTRRLRGFGRTPGAAALEETSGILPGSVAESARAKLTQLTSQLEQAAARSTTPATTQPAIDVVTQEMQKAAKQNNKTLYNALKDIHEQLTVDFRTGKPLGESGALPSGLEEPQGRWFTKDKGIAGSHARKGGQVIAVDIPETTAKATEYPNSPYRTGPTDHVLPDEWLSKAKPIEQLPSTTPQGSIRLFRGLKEGMQLPSDMRTLPASQLLDLKRGIGDLEGNWNPELRGKLKGIVRQVYSALDKELDRTVPEADKLNQRISSLIPVKGRAESVERGADITQRLAHRVAAHTGALLPSLAGGYYGYEKGGPVGAAAGIALPELLASPSGQMGMARVLNSPFTARALRAIGSQKLKGKSETE